MFLRRIPMFTCRIVRMLARDPRAGCLEAAAARESWQRMRGYSRGGRSREPEVRWCLTTCRPKCLCDRHAGRADGGRESAEQSDQQRKGNGEGGCPWGEGQSKRDFGKRAEVHRRERDELQEPPDTQCRKPCAGAIQQTF